MNAEHRSNGGCTEQRRGLHGALRAAVARLHRAFSVRAPRLCASVFVCDLRPLRDLQS